MTKMSALFKTMGWTKFRQMNQMILLELIAVAVTGIWTAIKGHFNLATLFYLTTSWSMLPYVVGFILLAVSTEKAYTADTFRLIPIEETRFYLMNLLSSLAVLVYFMIVQAVLYGLTLWLGWSRISGMLPPMMAVNTNVATPVLVMLLVSLMTALLIWSTISFVHLVTSATSNFLPKFRQRALNVVVYVIVIFITMRVAGFIVHGVAWFARITFNGTDLGQFWLALAAMAVVILIESILNVFLLKKWVETAAN
ncbi:ABC transporter permease [Lactiplantibacillus songbeiensis]|uniref:ABC transporter permease n=1 Tax=Lactiplantibacillus songbeiensis TaxID=2559920 RepID=A0ABW4C2R2_9LACO|nr:ABC transporter permease [Lactiplantibacillus songbeiensis]